METATLRNEVERACRHLLSEQNRDPYTLTYGCFDRRYWGWKLVDYAEATFQRNVYPLAWLLSQMGGEPSGIADMLTEAIIAGLEFAAKIQHRDGSFDQAFPNEHSFGATAFLLHPMLAAYQVVRDKMSAAQRAVLESCLHRGADFLCTHDETHGHIANHLAGAVLSLLDCAAFFGEARYSRRAQVFLQRILDHQSPEGWFLEYEGADPGYQTLCIHYLAQVFQSNPEEKLRKALVKAVDFLSWFVHPDGTFAGEYGSRRTAVYYPGGLALLQQMMPMARSITQFMSRSLTEGRTVTVNDVDIGNLAPLLSSTILLLDTLNTGDNSDLPAPLLPWQQENACRDFAAAGLYLRSTKRYYAVLGISNGGVLKVLDRRQQTMLWDDGGYVGEGKDGTKVTTQITDLGKERQATHEFIEVQAPFYQMLHTTPTPAQFILLRILNLTIMRNVWMGNRVKDLLVRRLISGKHRTPLELVRSLTFGPESIIVEDRIIASAPFPLRWLKCGRPFVAIHMASSRYFQGLSEEQHDHPQPINVEQLNRQGITQMRLAI